jgi:hypothetical protein|tara:strand:- start:1110 stop:1490 length:381 start_codon:yes stop_codon:yes gene_type:complete
VPIYVYKHPEEELYEEVLQGMNDPHVFSKDGVEWQRVFLSPNASISSNSDPFNSNAFLDKTANMKGTVGDMMDYSAELSEKRAEKSGGIDPIRKKHFDNYEKSVGKKHLNDAPKSFENKHIKVDLD